MPKHPIPPGPDSSVRKIRKGLAKAVQRLGIWSGVTTGLLLKMEAREC